MINKVENKYWRITHKYGKLTPKTIDEALRLDKEDGTNLWFTTIQKEMNKAKVDCITVDGATPEQVRSNQINLLRGFQEIKCHLIFDVKMDFTRKV